VGTILNANFARVLGISIAFVSLIINILSNF
jgi:hypothetical protein